MVWFVDKVSGPLLTGAVLAFVGGWWIARQNERYKSRRDLYSKAAESFRSDLHELVKLAGSYWSSPYDPLKSVQQEAEIAFLLGLIDHNTQICAGALWSNQSAKAPVLAADVVAAIYGPTFGTEQRTADPLRANRTATACTALATYVLSARRDFFTGSMSPVQAFWWGCLKRLVLAIVIIALLSSGCVRNLA